MPRDPSPLPPIEHRRVAALPAQLPSGSHADAGMAGAGAPPIEQLPAISEPAAHADVSNHAVPPVSDDHAVEVAGPEVGTRSGLAASRRRGLGPAYHGPLPEAIDAERRRDSTTGVTAEPVPDGLRATMRDALGIDVGDRLVHRGPAVSAEAAAMGAEAFTREGQVFVADEVGPLDELRGRATLAHELTHVAQQLEQGATPVETSDRGLLQEAHARRVEQHVRGDGGAAKPSSELLHARPSATTNLGSRDLTATQDMMRELVDTGLARPDGDGGIVFTMPASTMTASAGTQRLTASAPAARPGPAARQENWNAADVFGNTIAQGLGNDMLGMAGSFLGFSDEFMGEQRTELADADRAFRQEQTKRAYTELRMEHLQQVELQRRNADEALHGHERTMSLDDRAVREIAATVDHEVARRMSLLDAQAAHALHELNEARRTRHEPALDRVAGEPYDAAFHLLFDTPGDDTTPTDEQLQALLIAPPSTASPGGGTRPGGGARPGGGPPGAHVPTSAVTGGVTPGARPPGGTAPSHPGATGSGAPDAGTPESGDGAPEQHWRTDATMGGRFRALGSALLGDVVHDEIETFGSVFGFDAGFEQTLHDEVTPPHGTGTGASAVSSADAAHSDAAVSAPHHDDAAAARHSTADATVEHIVGDPYALDQLATRLYPNIRSRLRQELLIDRERAGLLADFR